MVHFVMQGLQICHVPWSGLESSIDRQCNIFLQKHLFFHVLLLGISRDNLGK